MKKKLAIIGASYLQLPLVLKAKEMGINTICFAWETGAVCKNYSDEYYPVSIIEKENILEICKSKNIDGITSIASDLAVSAVNYIANELKLIGNPIESIDLCLNKYLMRNAFRIKSLTIPDYSIVKNLNEIKNIKVPRFPVIVKPVDRSGSIGITLVKDATALKKAIVYAMDQSFIKHVIVEEYINGREISIESISWKGKHYILAYTDKITSGYPHFVELEHHQPSQLVKENNTEFIDEVVKNGLDSLNIKNGASHTELIITNKKEVFITEIGARMGGDFIGSKLVELSTGYDFLEGIINIAFGTFSKPEKIFDKFSGIYFFSDKTPKVKDFITLGHKDIVSYEINEPLQKELTQSSDRSGYFIYQSNKKIILTC